MRHLRPHHILCVRFLGVEPPGRGDDFASLSREIRDLMLSGDDVEVEITQGVDDLCMHCPHLGDNVCISPFGDEEKVRRWDARIIEGLGICYGEKKTAGELRTLINLKAPIEFCRDRCPWRSICGVFERK